MIGAVSVFFSEASTDTLMPGKKSLFKTKVSLELKFEIFMSR